VAHFTPWPSTRNGRSPGELREVYLADLKNQVENLKLLISSVESDFAKKHENKMLAENTDACLIVLKENLSVVEHDTDEAFGNRRTLVKLLVERITVGRDEAEARPRVDVTHRFGPPGVPEADRANGLQDTQDLWGALGRHQALGRNETILPVAAGERTGGWA
jgi:hypothetical protein